MNNVKILFNNRIAVTTPELNEILDHEKINVFQAYFNKFNELLVLCNSPDDYRYTASSCCATPQMIIDTLLPRVVQLPR